MKKITLFAATFLLFQQLDAQILNPGFELIDSVGNVANWGANSFVLPVDPSCFWTGLDSIKFATTDAHSGSYAFEIRVATYCADAYTQTIQSHRFDIDSFVDQRMLFTERASAFTFYYKLFPTGNDKATFKLSLQDSSGTVIADGSVTLTDAAYSWTLATISPNYYSTDTPSFINMRFELQSDSTLHYGSRFLIDDINSAVTTATNEITPTSKLSFYPNPAREQLFMQLSGISTYNISTVHVKNIIGVEVLTETVQPKDNLIPLNVRDLPKGMYYVTVSYGSNVATGKFLK